MKVTGWTYWDNENYIDIGFQNSLIRGRIMDSVPTKWPKFNSEEEKSHVIEQQQKHLEEVDEAFKHSEELQESNRLYNEVYETVVKDVRSHQYHFTGDEHQNCDYGVPVVDEKYILCLSMRQWGGLIAEAFPEEFDENDQYDYVVWAWYSNPKQEGKEKIPDESLWVE